MILKGLSSYPRSTNATGLLGGLIWRIRADAARAFGHTACNLFLLSSEIESLGISCKYPGPEEISLRRLVFNMLGA